MEGILLSQTATADFSPNIEQKYILNALALSSVLGMFLPFPHSSRSMQLLGFLFLRSFKNSLSSSSSDYGFYLLSLGFPCKFYFFPFLISFLFSCLSFFFFFLSHLLEYIQVFKSGDVTGKPNKQSVCIGKICHCTSGPTQVLSMYVGALVWSLFSLRISRCNWNNHFN